MRLKRIVSVTPLRVQEDSRTFKIAASFATFGYESVVVEGQPSTLDRAELPFRLISMGRGSEGGASTRPETDPSESTSRGSGVFRGIVDLPYKILRAIAALPFQLVTACDDESEPPDWLQVERRRNKLVRLNDVLLLKVVRPIYGLLPKPLKYLYQSLVGWTCFAIYLTYFVRTYLLTPLRYLPKADLYYLHAPYTFPAVRLLSRKYRVPYIYDAHDFYTAIGENERPTLLERRWIDPFLFRLERRCISRAAAVVTVCDGVARLQKEAFGCRSVVVRNCHDHRLDVKPKLQLRDVLGLEPEDFLIVTVGQAKEGQAIREALHAMQKLPGNVHLAFLGKNTERHMPLTQELGLENRVHPIPAVMPNEVVPFIESADAALIIYYARSPNYENCLPNGLFQSIAAKLPLLYPELPEIRKIAEHYDIGVPVNPLDPESIRAGVMRLMSNRDLSQEFRSNLSVAREELRWEREEDILRDLLSEVLIGFRQPRLRKREGKRREHG